MYGISKIFASLLVLQLLVSCKQDSPVPVEDFNVVIRMDRDIGRINPILSRTSRDREVYPYLFLNLADYDPKTLKFSPVLVEDLPTEEKLEDGRTKYSFRILEDAVWENGNQITANDFLFTLKLAAHPNIISPSFKSYLSTVDEVLIKENDMKLLELIVNEVELSTLAAVSGLEVYPEHIYDPNGILSKLSLDDLKDESITNKLVESDSSFVAFGADFSSTKFGVDNVEGAGPYKIKDWETDQYIRLEKKPNWWGAKYRDRSQLVAGPNEIVFQIIADETTAITKLKAGEIDLMRVSDGQAFNSLQSEFAESLDFNTTRMQQYTYLAVNNQDDLMKHGEIRKAIALSLDLEQIIETIESGTADPIAGTFESFVPGFKSKVSPVSQDVEKARKLLEDSGWQDSNENGIYDKSIDGQFTELNIDILSSSDKSEKMALLVKEFAKQVGIDLSVTRKTLRLIFNDHVYKGDYQMFPMVSRWGLSPYDPYGRWHSANAKTKGSNISYYKSTVVDSLINRVKTELDVENRFKLYHEIESILYEDQPVIFLNSPLDKFVSSKKIKAFTSNKRPGYFANLFELSKVPAFSEN